MTPSRFLLWTLRVHLAILPILILLSFVDGRELMGANLWWKPIKFFASVAIYLATIRYLLQWTTGRPLHWIGYGTALTMIGENLAIIGQAARGVRSHFNISSPLDGLVFNAMGILIMINTALLAWLFLWHCRHRIPTRDGLRWGIRWGLASTLVASAIGGLIIANQGHTIGAPDGGPGLAFLHWSTRAGDLRIAHFIGMHGIQVLPFLGWAADRSGSPRAWLLVAVAALAYLTVTALTLLQALGGKPILALAYGCGFAIRLSAGPS